MSLSRIIENLNNIQIVLFKIKVVNGRVKNKYEIGRL